MTTSTEELTEITDVVSALMAEYSTEADVRRASEPGAAYDSKGWLRLAEAGIAGIVIDADHDGAGLGAIELEAVAEVLGRALDFSPFLSSAVLAAGLLQATDDDGAKSRLLPAIASAELVATVAVTGPAGTWQPAGLGVVATEGGELTGTARYVTDAQIADVILVAANLGEGVALYEVAADAPGLSVRPLRTFDGTRRLADLEFEAVAGRRIGTSDTWAPVQAALDLGVVALAGDQVGGARAIFDLTIEYAKTRVQFGRTIGSFQAIKHLAADLYLELESATSAARDAARLLAEGSERASEAVALAGFTCAEAYQQIAAEAIFMHGGIGFTWEYPAHLYLRRARGDVQLLGAPALFRDRYLTTLGG